MMEYTAVAKQLGWPERGEVFTPSGGGPAFYAEYATKKIANAVCRTHPGTDVHVGVLCPDPTGEGSQAPLALICEFPRAVSDQILDQIHSLAWNFSRTSLLITLEPHRLIAWSCCQDPSTGQNRRLREFGSNDVDHRQEELAHLLHWISLITESYQHIYPTQFPHDGRADDLLLKNLRFIRQKMIDMGLERPICHDLLARIIFTQFLFQRVDSKGQPFLSARKIAQLHKEGVLSRPHADLASVLTHKTDTYSLFYWLDERFNGDLFPEPMGTSMMEDSRRSVAWQKEKKAVGKDVLNLLAEFVRGDIDVNDRQLCLWPHYSFDTIPLEFISSVYEEFLTADERSQDKAYYTPGYLVDFILDAVLPWNGSEWDLKILDPCCGSAIFLVKAFQRLIYRFRRAEKREPLVRDLRPILERNLVGIDKNEEAVRVASFSLYLAMADAIDPRHYLTRERTKVFPGLRGSRLIHGDFFDVAQSLGEPLFGEEFDLVLGNAPWGDGSARPMRAPGELRNDYQKRIKHTQTPVQKWATAHGWSIANNDIGPLFLPGAAGFLKNTGHLAMINNASLIYSRDGPATKIRSKLFQTYTFEEITNLSAVRRETFNEAIGPACIVIFRPQVPEPSDIFLYFAPKPVHKPDRRGRKKPPVQGLTIEPQDVETLTHSEACSDARIWSALAIGTRRDWDLLQRLMQYPNLQELKKAGNVITRLGVIPGDRKKALPDAYKKRRYFQDTSFPDSTFLTLKAANVPYWLNPRIDDKGSTDFAAFKNPQLLIKQTLTAMDGRFRAALVEPTKSEWGIICKKTYYSVCDTDSSARTIKKAALIYNSGLALYFLMLSSSRLSHYRPEVNSEELITVPLPASDPVPLKGLKSFEAIDKAAFSMFNLATAEKILIEDILNYVLPDTQKRTAGPGRKPTRRKKEQLQDPELVDYASTFTRVIETTFAQPAGATIYSEKGNTRLDARAVTIHLSKDSGVSIQYMNFTSLFKKLSSFTQSVIKHRPRDPSGRGAGFQRVSYLFQPYVENGKQFMDITILKPDECRYWTRSMAMRDADQLAHEISRVAKK